MVAKQKKGGDNLAGLEAFLAILSVLAVLAVTCLLWRILGVERVPISGKVVGKAESLVHEMEYFTPLSYLSSDFLMPSVPVMVEKKGYFLIIQTGGLIPKQTKVPVDLEVWLRHKAGDYFEGEVKAA